MARDFNTDTKGKTFSERFARKVWRNWYGDALGKTDICGAGILLSEYGMTTSCGWHVDHIRPKAKGGKDDMSNLRPLHWANNEAKGDTYLELWEAAIPPGGLPLDTPWLWRDLA